ncbi:hypothetical protein OENI_980015 [Oenococcus oeni]|nr:hypothetical protein OENI_980015 [Oenococcus oeni]
MTQKFEFFSSLISIWKYQTVNIWMLFVLKRYIIISGTLLGVPDNYLIDCISSKITIKI